MFGSQVLEVAIGLVLLFLFVSLICTAAQEALQLVLKWRGAILERGVRELLGVSTPSGSGATAAANPTDGSGILKSFYEHPLIAALYGGPYMPGRTSNLPSYIPSLSFAGAVLDLAARSGAGDTKPMSVAAIRAGLATLPNERLRRTVLLALDAGGDDLQAVKAELARIFDASMDRVSGWYKRRTQWVLLALGLVAAVALNIDPIHVARRLAADEALRQAAVSGAEGLIASPPVQLARGATPPPATGDVAAPPVANGLGQAARDPAGPARPTDRRAGAANSNDQGPAQADGRDRLPDRLGGDAGLVVVDAALVGEGLVVCRKHRGLADHGSRGDAWRAVLVRRAQQVHGDPLDGEAAREEPRGGVRRSPTDGGCSCAQAGASRLTHASVWARSEHRIMHRGRCGRAKRARSRAVTGH